MRTPDGTATLGGATHLPTQAGPQLPGPVPIPGAPGPMPAPPLGAVPSPAPAENPVPLQVGAAPPAGLPGPAPVAATPGCRVGRNPWWHHPLQCRPTANSSVPSRRRCQRRRGSQVSRAAPGRPVSRSRRDRRAVCAGHREPRRLGNANGPAKRRKPGKPRKPRNPALRHGQTSHPRVARLVRGAPGRWWTSGRAVRRSSFGIGPETRSSWC